jgi:hypothetical protein
MSARFGIVTKINGHGHIFVQLNDSEKRFNKHGEEYKNERFGDSLVDADKLEKYLDDEAKRKAVASVARKIENTMKEGWSYSGTWHKSDDRIAELKSLIAELEGV